MRNFIQLTLNIPMAQEEPEKNNKEAERARENSLLKKINECSQEHLLLTCGVSVWERGQDGQKARTEA